MPVHIDSVVFVYQQKRKPYMNVCIYSDDPQPDKGWKHTGTIDPAKWIEHLLNKPEDRQKHIESIMF